MSCHLCLAAFCFISHQWPSWDWNVFSHHWSALCVFRLVAREGLAQVDPDCAMFFFFFYSRLAAREELVQVNPEWYFSWDWSRFGVDSFTSHCWGLPQRGEGHACNKFRHWKKDTHCCEVYPSIPSQCKHTTSPDLIQTCQTTFKSTICATKRFPKLTCSMIQGKTTRISLQQGMCHWHFLQSPILLPPLLTSENKISLQ